jgi:hypothetical protein
VLTLVAMICDMSLLNMLNLVVQFIMIYIMVLIWKLPNISTLGTPSAREDDATWWLTWGAVAVGVLVVWTSLGPLPRWVPGPTTRWALGTTRLALHGT